jgi:hypothetical protein
MREDVGLWDRITGGVDAGHKSFWEMNEHGSIILAQNYFKHFLCSLMNSGIKLSTSKPNSNDWLITGKEMPRPADDVCTLYSKTAKQGHSQVTEASFHSKGDHCCSGKTCVLKSP